MKALLIPWCRGEFNIVVVQFEGGQDEKHVDPTAATTTSIQSFYFVATHQINGYASSFTMHTRTTNCIALHT
jgi:hypothetical protein